MRKTTRTTRRQQAPKKDRSVRAHVPLEDDLKPEDTPSQLDRFEAGELRSLVRNLLLGEIRYAVIETAHQLVEDEVEQLAGERYGRKADDNPLRRYGRRSCRIMLDGQPVAFERPRVRDLEQGREVPLERMAALQDRDALDDDVKRLLIRGISTRNYDEALTKMADGLGLKRSAVSEAFIKASKKDLDAINSRRLDDDTYVALYIDGKTFKGTICLVAAGITRDGKKRILGLREGSTENARLAIDLLRELLDRGLTLTRRALFVIDGSRALRKAIKDIFGDQALVQRCQFHKAENVVGYLPKTWHGELRRKLRAAWSMTSHDEAESALRQVVRWLRAHNESAANSLEEGFEETLTVHRLGITGALRKTLSTTNPIESIFSQVAALTRRVKRWRGPSMVLRWVGSSLVRIEPKLRRIRGYREIPALIHALETNPDTRCHRQAV